MRSNLTVEAMAQKLFTIGKEYRYCNDDGGIEVYTDYNDKLSQCDIAKFFESDNPRMEFNEMISEWEQNAFYEYGLFDDFFENVTSVKELTAEESSFIDENETEIKERLEELAYAFVDIDDVDADIRINMMIDTGNWTYDCTCDNVLNWDSRYYKDIDNNGSLLWLARKFRKENLLRKAVAHVKRHGYRGKYRIDKFINSCIDEYENLGSHMGTLTFLVSLPATKLFGLYEAVEMLKTDYDGRFGVPAKKKRYVTIDKNTMCGLFNPWDGGGSLLDVVLPSKIKIPLERIYRIQIDTPNSQGWSYTVGDVYGLISSAWTEIGKVSV